MAGKNSKKFQTNTIAWSVFLEINTLHDKIAITKGGYPQEFRMIS